MARPSRDPGDLTAPASKPLGGNDSLAGALPPATRAVPARGFVRCVNTTTGGVADLPEAALADYRSRGWQPLDEAHAPDLGDVGDTPADEAEPTTTPHQED